MFLFIFILLIRYKNNEIICNVPPYHQFRPIGRKKTYGNETTNNNNFKNGNLRKNEPNIITIKLEYYTSYWDEESYQNYPIDQSLYAAFIDFDDKEENYTSIACDDTDINTCDKCGICGGDNECVACDNTTLYYTECNDNCNYVDEEYYYDKCVPYSYYDCFGEIFGGARVSKSNIGTGIECCDKKKGIDCYGSCDGKAIIDKCNNCIGGATGKTDYDSYDCYNVCNGTRKPPCNSSIVYNKNDIVLQHEITDLLFVDTIIPFDGFINGTAAIYFTGAYVYPQIPYYPKLEVQVAENGTNYFTISQFMQEKIYIVPNKTIYFRVIAVTSRFNSYSAKSVERHRITINYLSIFDNVLQKIEFNVHLTYKNCEKRKGYEQCYLPGCSFCIDNNGYNVATEAKLIGGVCVDGNLSVCQNVINRPNDGFMFIFCNLWLFVIVLFIL